METEEICEGLAVVRFPKGEVFYNPVQSFNRDLSVLVLRAYFSSSEHPVSILDGLSASGLRALRYSLELPPHVNISSVYANDVEPTAVQNIRNNFDLPQNSKSASLRSVNQGDICRFCYEKFGIFDAIDIDPYGSPAPFIDAACASVRSGGIVLVTATDAAVLCGKYPETCYAKYGSIPPVTSQACHEIALRILLYTISSSAARHRRYIQPLLSISTDFYFRVFVRISDGAKIAKDTCTKHGHVIHSSACPSFSMISASVKKSEGKYRPTDISDVVVDDIQSNKYGSKQLCGPLWLGELHDREFIDKLLSILSDDITLSSCDGSAIPCISNARNWKKIKGVLSVCREELINAPLYYTMPSLAKSILSPCPPKKKFFSVLENMGYEVSASHCSPNGFKTTAPDEIVWDVLRCWVEYVRKTEKVNEPKEGSVQAHIRSVKPNIEVDFDLQNEGRNAKIKQEKKEGRFFPNPERNWGPKRKAKRGSTTEESVLKKPKS